MFYNAFTSNYIQLNVLLENKYASELIFTDTKYTLFGVNRRTVAAHMGEETVLLLVVAAEVVITLNQVKVLCAALRSVNTCPS